jgi:hypothetical protein
MNELLRALLYGSFALAGVVAASFLLWLRLRNRPAWDMGLFAAATGAMLILCGLGVMSGPLAVIFTFSTGPALILYVWFASLWRLRRTHAGILRWAARQGYVVTTLERLAKGYRIVARRRSDGQIRSGRVMIDGGGAGNGIDVIWDVSS